MQRIGAAIRRARQLCLGHCATGKRCRHLELGGNASPKRSARAISTRRQRVQIHAGGSVEFRRHTVPAGQLGASGLHICETELQIWLGGHSPLVEHSWVPLRPQLKLLQHT